MVPTPPTGVILASAGLVFAALAGSLAYAVGTDARERGQSSTLWGVGAVAVPAVLPAYALGCLVWFDRRDTPPTRRERVAGAIGGGGLLALVSGAVLTPPDPFSQVRWLVVAVPLAIPVAYVLLYRVAYPLERSLT